MLFRTTLLVLLAGLFLCAGEPDPSLELPPIRAQIPIDNQSIALVIRATVAGNQLRVNADLGDLQTHIGDLLRARLNESNHCGERLSVENAALVPAAPGALLIASVHFEKWGCVKAFGREAAKRLIGGDGKIEVRLLPVVKEGQAVQLDAHVGEIQADGKVGEALRSGQFGDALREKIRTSLESSLQKSLNLQAALPPSIEPIASIRTVQFADAGGGRLACNFMGEVRLSAEQMRGLIAQAKAR